MSSSTFAVFLCPLLPFALAPTPMPFNSCIQILQHSFLKMSFSIDARFHRRSRLRACDCKLVQRTSMKRKLKSLLMHRVNRQFFQTMLVRCRPDTEQLK
jgi:hypothetical protein